MPYKDPEKKRAYDREYRRRRGEKKKRAGLWHGLIPSFRQISNSIERARRALSQRIRPQRGMRPGLRQCPCCEGWSVHKEYTEDGSCGYWCDHCLLFITPLKKEVGGWLLLLCLGLIFIYPITSGYSILSSYNKLMPYFNIYQGLFVVTIIDSILSIGLISFSMYVGISLLIIKKNSVELAILFFLLVLAYQIIIPLLLLVISLPREYYKIDIVKHILMVIVVCAIWLAYLNKSKRVKNTYGELKEDAQVFPQEVETRRSEREIP